MSTIGKVATFARGINVIQPFLVCVLGSSFAMKRFGYEEDAVSIFVAFCSNAMEIFYMLSCLPTLMISALLKYSPWTKDLFTQISSGMSMTGACLTVTINALLLRTYALDDDVDNVTRYYWLLLMANFAAGIDVTCIATLSADVISNYELGFALAGIVLACFHWFALKFLKSYDLEVNYWLVVSQLLFVVTLSAIAAVSWFVYLVQDKILGASGDTDHSSDATTNGSSPMGYLRTLPMVVASSIGLGTLWAIYPYVSPFEMVEFRYQYPIQRFCLVFQAVCGISLWFMDNVSNCVRQDWYKYPYAWWHFIWFLFIPYFGIAALFLHCMHYPESGVSRVVLRRPFVVGPLTVIYYCLSRTIYGLSPVPIDVNSMGHGEIVLPMCRTLSFMTMNILKYMSEAYVQKFKLAKEGVKAGKAWPTDGMSKHTAIQYWIRIAATLGYTNFKELATADVKQRLGGVARHIVSYRRIGSTG